MRPHFLDRDRGRGIQPPATEQHGSTLSGKTASDKGLLAALRAANAGRKAGVQQALFRALCALYVMPFLTA
jgi:hypothetical protein